MHAVTRQDHATSEQQPPLTVLTVCYTVAHDSHGSRLSIQIIVVMRLARRTHAG